MNRGNYVLKRRLAEINEQISEARSALHSLSGEQAKECETTIEALKRSIRSTETIINDDEGVQ